MYIPNAANISNIFKNAIVKPNTTDIHNVDTTAILNKSNDFKKPLIIASISNIKPSVLNMSNILF